jgi:hypothetical protein
MPTSIPRVAYFAQSGKLVLPRTGIGQSGETIYVLPVNSANIEVTRPIEAVTAFGQFDSLNTAQTNITTCKSTLKVYLGTGNLISGLTSTLLDELISTTQSGKIGIIVEPAGFKMTGILSSIGIDISLGSFAMADLSFDGVGNPEITDGTSSATSPGTRAMTIAPVTTLSIGSGQALSGIFATSIKFSYDLPTETLGALGENPNAIQSEMRSIIATKAPYKSSITVEGYGIDLSSGRLDTSITGVFGIGNIGVSLPKAKISSKSLNNAAGQVSATFSITAEDVGATFSTIGVSGYAQNFSQSGLPMYGG